MKMLFFRVILILKETSKDSAQIRMAVGGNVFYNKNSEGQITSILSFTSSG